MLHRRKLITGLAAAAVCTPSIAKAAWAQFMASSPGPAPIVATPAQMINAGYFKPSGVPYLNVNDPITNGLLWYAYDTGMGFYALLFDQAPGHLLLLPSLYNANSYGGPSGSSCPPGTWLFCNPPFNPPSSGGPYGNNTAWPNLPGTVNYYGAGTPPSGVAVNSFIVDTDPIRTACNLAGGIGGGASAPVGGADKQGVTFGCSFAKATTPTQSCVILGRCIPEGDNLFGIFTDSSDEIIGAYNPSNGNPITPGSTIGLRSIPTYAVQQLHTAFLTAVNVGAGTANATVSLWVDGTQPTVTTLTGGATTNPLTGQTIIDNGGNAYGVESQLNIGSFSHLTANAAARIFNGVIPWGAVWNRDLSAGEILRLTTNPYAPIKLRTGF